MTSSPANPRASTGAQASHPPAPGVLAIYRNRFARLRASDDRALCWLATILAFKMWRVWFRDIAEEGARNTHPHTHVNHCLIFHRPVQSLLSI